MDESIEIVREDHLDYERRYEMWWQYRRDIEKSVVDDVQYFMVNELQGPHQNALACLRDAGVLCSCAFGADCNDWSKPGVDLSIGEGPHQLDAECYIKHGKTRHEDCVKCNPSRFERRRRYVLTDEGQVSVSAEEIGAAYVQSTWHVRTHVR